MAYIQSMASEFGKLGQEICRNCGQRHFERSRQNRICGGINRTNAYLASAAGIIEKALEAREEAEARMAAAREAIDGGSRQARHLAAAEAAYQLAWELEN